MPVISIDPTFAEVEDNSLPHPAARLVITQILQWVVEPAPTWAWIIVGVYYDCDGVPIWSQEVFVGHLGIELESDSEHEGESEGETVAVRESQSGDLLRRPVGDTHQGWYL